MQNFDFLTVPLHVLFSPRRREKTVRVLSLYRRCCMLCMHVCARLSTFPVNHTEFQLGQRNNPHNTTGTIPRAEQ